MRASVVRSTLLLGTVSFLGGCYSPYFAIADNEPKPHPVLGQAEELREAKAFSAKSLVTLPPVTRESVPPENRDQVFQEARRASGNNTGENGGRVMSLQDVRKRTLENNLSLKVARYNPSISKAGYDRELSKFEQVFSLSTTYGQTFDSTARARATDSFTLTPSVNVPLRNGSSVTLSLPVSHTDSTPLATVTKSIGTKLAVSVPLLRNAGTRFNTASIRSAGLAVRQADTQTKLEAITVLANSEKAYWNYWAANENLRIQVEQYELSQQQLDVALKLVDEGVRTKVEATRAESGIAQRFTAVISAETTRRQTERSLKTFMNDPDMPVQSKTTIVPTTLPDPLGLTFNRDAVVELALTNRMELLSNEIQLAIDRITVSNSRNQILPSVSFDFSYAFTGSQPTFRRAIKQIFRTAGNDYSLGLTASIPLAGNQAAKATLRESILSLARTKASRQVLDISIREEVLNAIDAVEQNWQQILSNANAVARADETYREEQEEFQQGFVTSTEVLEALANLATARSNEVTSIRDYQNSVVDLAFATGTVLGSGGVVWTPLSEDFPEAATLKPSYWNPRSELAYPPTQ
ncbi:MAG: TolC family protein [Pseudomonadota bacterium]